ncbi:translocation/assembly module TamB domain-containing protein [Pontivivens insulae]|uniref:Translocation and assembly module TamB C-terminal domain-containing protein n=1 Tax=Pontivivens insulae TaxID=1639689 RepID=A0A2R8A8C2_9RHOB|nr:translocation/assembly module TamB [Pontivivens insulae]RED18583.1 uncharacterized protein DUF490 [Pontivivens insulae]SPF28481.1 hypothetical protein POI8812_00782 [Pontivivens insulae]
MRRLILTVFIWVMPVFAWAQTSIFDLDNRLVQFALSQISSPGSFEIVAELVDDTETGATRLNGVSILDGQGVWMTIDQLVVDWNSSRILRGELALNEILIRGMNVARAPAAGSEAPELDVEQTQGTPSPFDWPRAPIPVVLNQLVMEDIRIGPDVFGHTITFDASGRAADQDDEQRLVLDVERTDEISGQIAIEYLRDFAADTLNVDLTAQEEPGGLVATLAGLPPGSASNVTLQGEGTRTAFDLSFDAQSDAVFEATGTATVSTVAPLSAIADFSVDAGPQFPASLRPIVGETATFSADIAEGDDQIVRVRRLRLESPALGLEATGTFNRATASSDLAVFLDAGRDLAALTPGARFETVTFEGRVTGPPDDLRAQGQATVAELRSAIVDAEAVVLDINATRVGEVLNLTANGDGRGLRLDELDENTLGEAFLRLDLRQDPEGIELRRLLLESPVLELTAAGQTTLDFLNLNANLAVETSDLGQITRAYDFPATGTLTLDADVQRVNGVVSGTAAGRLSNFASTPADAESVDLRIDLGQEAETIRATLRADADGLRLDQIDPSILGESRLGLTVLLEPDTITLRDASLSARPFQLEATADMDRDTGALRFDYDLRTRQLAPIAAAYDVPAGGQLRSTGMGALTDGVLDTTVEVVLERLRYANLATGEQILVNANVTGAGDYDIVLDLRGRGVEGFDLSAADLGEVSVQAEGLVGPDVLAVNSFNLSSRLLDATGRAQLDPTSGDAEGAATLAVSELAPLSALIGQDVSGRAALELEGGRRGGVVELTANGGLGDFTHPLADVGQGRFEASLRQASGTTELSADAALRALRVDQIGPEIWGATTLRVDATMLPEGVIVEQARVESDALDLTVSGDLTPDGPGLDYEATVPQIAPIAQAYAQDASGAVRLTGTARPGEPVQATGTLAATDLTYNGTRFGTLRLTHDVEIDEQINASLQLVGEGGTLADTNLSANVTANLPSVRVDGLQGRVAGQQVNGAVAADLSAGPRLDGSVNLTSVDLAALDRALGLGAQFEGSGSLTLTLEGGTSQSAALTGGLRNIGAGATRLAGIDLSARLDDLFGAPRVQADLSTSGLTAGQVVIDGLSVQANGPLTSLRVAGQTEGALGTIPISLDLASTIALGDGATRVTLDTLSLIVEEDETSLTQPLTLLLRNGIIDGGPLEILLPGGGQILGEVDLIGGGLVGELRIANADLGAMTEPLPVSISGGRMNLRASFDTRPGRATAELRGAFDKVLATDILDEGSAVNATVSGDWDGRRFVTEARIQAEVGEPFVITADLPVRAGPGPIPSVQMNQPFTSELRWAGELRPLWALVPVSGQILSGLATLDLELSGSLSAPSVGGNISVSDGRYENLDAGLILTELTVISDFFENDILTLLINASDGGSGELFGQLDIRAGDGPITVASQFEAIDAVLIRRDDLSAQLSGTVGIAGPLNDLVVEGDVEIDRAELRLVNSSPPEIVTLGDIRMIGDDPPREAPPPPAILRLDVDVRAADGVFVRGRGLESEWRVALDIRGTATQPRILGSVERLRGTFSLLGRSFDLSRGEVVFNGGAKIDPQLDIALTRADRDLVGQILVTGPASNPTLSFASEPALPEEEVLPQLLFGTSQQSLSAGDALQLAAGIATLVSGSAGPLDVVRGALGVDVLRIEGGSEGQAASLTVGKTLGEGIFVGARTQADGTSAIRIELDVFENITVDAEISTGGDSSSVGITYSTDF